jgi:hypothetical protein
VGCCYCGRRDARPLADEVTFTDPDTDQPVTLRPVMCPTCELLVFPEVAAVSDEDIDLDDDSRRLRGLAQFWIQTELSRIYTAKEERDGCWWCGVPGRELSITQRAAGVIEFSAPVLCFACQGLLHMVGGGFSLQDDAEWEAQKEAYERVLRRAR